MEHSADIFPPACPPPSHITLAIRGTSVAITYLVFYLINMIKREFYFKKKKILPEHILCAFSQLNFFMWFLKPKLVSQPCVLSAHQPVAIASFALQKCGGGEV